MVKHVLSDGRTLSSIDGYKVERKDADEAYRIIDSLNARRNHVSKKIVHNEKG